jgi:hypothetical protein
MLFLFILHIFYVFYFFVEFKDSKDSNDFKEVEGKTLRLGVFFDCALGRKVLFFSIKGGNT